MDIRIEKTKQSIINAFIEIRSRKEVERITVKELCEKARINKSTFYAHYKDIYDLSDQLETELVDSIMENFNHPENLLQNPADFTKEIFMGYMAKDTLIRTLFSGSFHFLCPAMWRNTSLRNRGRISVQNEPPGNTPI